MESNERTVPLITHLPQLPLLPQRIITSGTRKDCVRLRGLPYEAQVEHILDFLGDHAKNIVFQGVHMVYNAQVIHFFYYYEHFLYQFYVERQNTNNFDIQVVLKMSTV